MQRYSPININQEDFKKIGYSLIDTIAAFFDNIKDKPVTTGETSVQLQQILGNATLPEKPAMPAH